MLKDTYFQFQSHNSCLSVIQVLLCFRWIWELHLHLGNRLPRDRGGSVGQSSGQLPRLRPVCVLLVPYVWVAHWHTAYQTTQTDNWRTSWRIALDGQWSSRQPLERGQSPCATHKQTLSGKLQFSYIFRLNVDQLVLNAFVSIVAKGRTRGSQKSSQKVTFCIFFKDGDWRSGGEKKLGRYCCGWH